MQPGKLCRPRFFSPPLPDILAAPGSRKFLAAALSIVEFDGHDGAAPRSFQAVHRAVVQRPRNPLLIATMPATHAHPEDTDALWRAWPSSNNFCAASPRDIARLASVARERLAAGDPKTAFALADRVCRLIVPSAREIFLRAQAHRAMGRLEAARRDLAAAMALDPTEFAIDHAALSWGDAPSRRQAAQRVAGRATAEAALLQKAVELLVEDESGVAHRLERTPQGVSGWLVWPDSEELEIEVRGAKHAQSFVVDPDPEHWLSAPGLSAAEIAIEGDSSTTLFLDLRLSGDPVERVSPAWDPQPSRTQTPRPMDARQHAEVDVTIIVPVYEDLDSTRACLEALELAKPAIAHRILVVDDASPNPTLKGYLAEVAARGDIELLTNDANIGFAASVNKALALSSKGDALLLNADVILPPGAVDRLAALSRSSPDIGTVTPLSNNGELTSYPAPHQANPTPTLQKIAALDALARSINGGALVEMPNGVGFCLYITEACLDAVGGLPEVYAQGYYEDVEFCLAARDRGFRNVAAPGVYVGHFGSKSFGERKRALVMRNLELIEARYPGYQIESAAFVALDPLQHFRAALDAAAPPIGPVVVVACGPKAAAALGRRRAEDLKAEAPDATVLLLRANPLGRSASLVAVGGGAPQSLQFNFDEASAQDAYLAYLAKLDVRRVELLDSASLPEAALTPLISGNAEDCAVMQRSRLVLANERPPRYRLPFPRHAVALRCLSQPGRIASKRRATSGSQTAET